MIRLHGSKVDSLKSQQTEWLQSTLAAFDAEIADLTIKEREALASELAAVSVSVSDIEKDTTKSAEERQHARTLLSSISAKRHLLSARLTAARMVQRESKKNVAEDLLESASSKIESGEHADAMRAIIKTMRLMWGIDDYRANDDDERGSK